MLMWRYLCGRGEEAEGVVSVPRLRVSRPVGGRQGAPADHARDRAEGGRDSERRSGWAPAARPQRQAQQVDPMTPFLFLIVAQDLSGLVNQTTRRNLFSRIKVGDKNVKVNLLQFADDTLFFCESSMSYEAESSQKRDNNEWYILSSMREGGRVNLTHPHYV